MNIKIVKSSKVCAVCERAFVHDEEVRSLVRVEEEEFIREDYCQSCWAPDTAETAYSMWSPRYYDPRVAEAEPPEVFSPLRQIFYEAVESQDRDVTAMAYLAGQLLRRQKVFRLIKEADDLDGNAKVILFHDRIGNRLIEMHDPNLSYAELEIGRGILMERLNELENPVPEDLGEDSEAGEEAEHAEASEDAN